MNRAHYLGCALFLSAAGTTGCLTPLTEDAQARSTADDERCLGRCDSTGDIYGLNDFEFIIVGSGAGGGPLAANLSKNHKVLLLEAGGNPGSDGAPASERLHYQIPAYHRESTEDPMMRWDYLVEHYSDQTLARADTKYCGPGATGQFCQSIADRSANGPSGVFYPRSSALGGCTAHNAMITIAPQDSDWQFIQDLTGNADWSPSTMRGMFAEVERNHYLDWSKPMSDPIWQGHGRTGWLSVEFPDSRLALGDPKILLAVQGAQQAFTQVHGGNAITSLSGLLGLMNRDLNMAQGLTENLYTIPLAVDNATTKHMRNSTREFILDAVHRPNTNLTVRLHSLVTKVVFADEMGGGDPTQAVGVDFVDGVRIYHADRAQSLRPDAPYDASQAHRVVVQNPGEVILAAGAFNTPQLLMQSGIGPEDHLRQVHAIAEEAQARVNLPGVGTNLQDRYEVGVVGTFTGYSTLYPHLILDGHFDGARETSGDMNILHECTFAKEPDINDPCIQQWMEGGGPYGSNGGVTAWLQRSPNAASPDPDLVIFGLPGEFHGYHLDYSGQIVRNQFTWAILKAHTQNQTGPDGLGGGTVELRPNPIDPSLPPDPRVPPAINFHSFAEGRNDQGQGDRDLEAMVDGTLYAMQIHADMDRKMFFGGGHFSTDWPPVQAVSNGSSADVEIVNAIVAERTNHKVVGAAQVLDRLKRSNDWYAQCARPNNRPNGCEEVRTNLREWVRREAWGHHASCTAPIGIGDIASDPALGTTSPGYGVLDSHFRVRGTRNLRVVDASVFPKIPGVFVVMPVYMMSQRAYHTIENDWAAAGAVAAGNQNNNNNANNSGNNNPSNGGPSAVCGEPGDSCEMPGDCCSGECDPDWKTCY